MGCDRDSTLAAPGKVRLLVMGWLDYRARPELRRPSNYYHDNPLILLNILWSHRVKISSVRRVVTSFFLDKVLSGLIQNLSLYADSRS